MINSACERIKELESQVRELSVAAEGCRAQRDAATTERDQLAARCERLLPLARRALHNAFCYNDHNFNKSCMGMAKDTAIECGINSFDGANDFLSESLVTSLARHDAKLLRSVADELDKEMDGDLGETIDDWDHGYDAGYMRAVDRITRKADQLESEQ